MDPRTNEWVGCLDDDEDACGVDNVNDGDVDGSVSGDDVNDKDNDDDNNEDLGSILILDLVKI